MKTILILWLCSICSAVAFSGTVISPVIVEVVDEHGNGVPAAKVQIRGNLIKDIPKYEIDSKSKYAEFARKAVRARFTDEFGIAVVFCAGGYLPDKKHPGIQTSVLGTVVVEAKNYVKAEVKFDRDFRTKKQGVTRLAVRLTIELKPAEQGSADQPTTAQKSKSEGDSKPQPKPEGRSK